MSPRLPLAARLLSLCALASLSSLAACGADESSEAADSDDTGSPFVDAGGTADTGETPDGAQDDGSGAPTEDTGVVDLPSIGRCDYTNPFSNSPECKEYTGDGWTVEGAEGDCAENLGGGGTFVAGEVCGFEAELGRCDIGDPAGEGTMLVLSGSNDGQCAISQTACETFSGGTFRPSPVCEDTGPVTPPAPDGVFQQPQFACVEPVEGEAPGNGPDGTVCTWSSIQGCTEPGRRFDDYGSCDLVVSQRPYYPFAVEAEVAPDDPRLTDETYQAELDWVTEQVEACACVCCHSDESSPSGSSGWFIEADPIWIDTIPDSGVAMLAGLVASDAFGGFDAEDNNGFDRFTTGLPTTDIDRMQTFFLEEYLRRGYAVEDAAEIPAFGGPLVTQQGFEPGPCGAGEGIGANGEVIWSPIDARYVYILEAGSRNPGVPPNLDTPDGTVWRLDVPEAGTPLVSGTVIYGEVPEGIVQRFPEAGAPAALTSGETYYMYALLDVGVPVTRCLFVAP
jgi:hypothetical protein